MKPQVRSAVARARRGTEKLTELMGALRQVGAVWDEGSVKLERVREVWMIFGDFLG